jgi:hypothetical protein
MSCFGNNYEKANLITVIRKILFSQVKKNGTIEKQLADSENFILNKLK